MELKEIKALIKAKIKTRQDVAEEIGISYSTLNKWLLNDDKAPKQAAKKIVIDWAERQ